MATCTESLQLSGPGTYAPSGEALFPRVSQHHWLWVMCLIGVDYFSSLAYQPSITYEVAGPLGPLATVVVVLVTLFGVLPVYAYLAGRSPQGQGSIALLERLVRGWRGKTVVLLLLGFAATDYVITKTLSLADAALHLIHNDAPAWQHTLDNLVTVCQGFLGQRLGHQVERYFDRQMVVTLLLGLVCFLFWALMRKGFTRRAVVLSVVVVGLYLGLSAVVIGSALLDLVQHPARLAAWHEQVHEAANPLSSAFWLGSSGLSLAAVCILFFPQLALGLSGFEMSLVIMPQIKGHCADDPAQPRGRIRNTRKALVLVALIMSAYLLTSVLVTSVLVAPEVFEAGGSARHRALAYLAHGGSLADGRTAGQLNPLFGEVFGTIYDVSTVLILCLAGMSVLTVLQTLLPQFLLRFGMELKWARKWNVLFALFALVNLAVTLWFHASVEAQRGAYATAVLVLLSNGCIASTIDLGRRGGFWSWVGVAGFGLLSACFLATTVAVLSRNLSGLLIAGGFILVLLVSSILSRALRAGELRTIGFEFVDADSRALWEKLKYLDFPVLIPHRPGRRERDSKEECMRREHQLAADVEIVFMEVDLEDPSEFLQNLLIRVFQEDKRFVIQIQRCVSVAHAIAAVALEMSRLSKAPALHFGWTEMSLLEASWSYLALGEGNVPWRVRELIHREEHNPERRPRVVVG